MVMKTSSELLNWPRQTVETSREGSRREGITASSPVKQIHLIQFTETFSGKISHTLQLQDGPWYWTLISHWQSCPSCSQSPWSGIDNMFTVNCWLFKISHQRLLLIFRDGEWEGGGNRSISSKLKQSSLSPRNKTVSVSQTCVCMSQGFCENIRWHGRSKDYWGCTQI